MPSPIDNKAISQLFADARTHVAWQSRPVEDALMQQLYDTMRWAPTSANCSPMRVVFVKSSAAKEKLKPCLAEGNREKTMNAPVCAIIAQDMTFYEKLPELFPHADAKSWFVGKPDYIQETAFRNASLQGGYFILAARALGLDCGPMSGFDKAKCDEAFFTGTEIKSNFLINLGYGDASKLHPRGPRLNFEDVCRIE